MGLLRLFIRKDLAELHGNGVRVRVIGERDDLDPDIRRLLEEAEELTRGNTNLLLVVAFNYGGARRDRARGAPHRGGRGERRAAARRHHRGADRAASRCAGHRRSRSHHPHQRRAAAVELPALAGGLFGARVHAGLLAGLRPRGARSPRSRNIAAASAGSAGSSPRPDPERRGRARSGGHGPASGPSNLMLAGHLVGRAGAARDRRRLARRRHVRPVLDRRGLHRAVGMDACWSRERWRRRCRLSPAGWSRASSMPACCCSRRSSCGAMPSLGLTAILFLFAVVWATDIAAYFAGRAIGGPKLWPAVSPNKTWSGAIGGTLGGVAAGLVVVKLVGACYRPNAGPCGVRPVGRLAGRRPARIRDQAPLRRQGCEPAHPRPRRPDGPARRVFDSRCWPPSWWDCCAGASKGAARGLLVW